MASETSYFRVAWLCEKLKRRPEDIAEMYLRASWEAEDAMNDKLMNRNLAASLANYELSLKSDSLDSSRRPGVLFNKGELLRRLGKFDEAKKHLESIRGQAGFRDEPYSRMIPAELDLIEKKNDKPAMIPPRDLMDSDPSLQAFALVGREPNGDIAVAHVRARVGHE